MKWEEFAIELYPYRSAWVTGGMALPRHLIDEGMLAKICGHRKDNHTVYVLRKGGVFECALMFSDSKVYVTDEEDKFYPDRRW